MAQVLPILEAALLALGENQPQSRFADDQDRQ